MGKNRNFQKIHQTDPNQSSITAITRLRGSVDGGFADTTINNGLVSMSLELFPEKSFHQKMNGTILNLSGIPGNGKENLRSVEWQHNKSPFILVDDPKISGKNDSLEHSRIEKPKEEKKNAKKDFRERAIMLGLAKMMAVSSK